MNNKKYGYGNYVVSLLGIFQKSYMIGESYIIGGHKGGQIAYPVAVIEFDDGTISECVPEELKAINENNSKV